MSGDVTALGVGHASGGTRVILAAVSGFGLWRKVGSDWARIQGTAPFQSSSMGTFVWQPKTSVVYAQDGEGVWRSNAAGALGSWRKLQSVGASYDVLNALALDPANPRRLFISGQGGVWRMDGVDTDAPVAVRILTLSAPGAIATLKSGALLVHDRGGARLLMSSNAGATAPTFKSAANAFYSDNNAGIRSLAVGADDFVYTASNHAGFTVGTPQP